MTDKEKAIVMAHTGICMLTGDKFQIFHKYVEDIMGRPIFTHEMGWLEDEIKEKSKADFIALCADESSSEKPNKCFDGITNGEVIRALFPNLYSYDGEDYVLLDLSGFCGGKIGKKWWDEPYKAERGINEYTRMV